MKEKAFERLCKSIMAEKLIPAGFVDHGGLYVRERDIQYHVIALKLDHPVFEQFTFDLGFHYSFILLLVHLTEVKFDELYNDSDRCIMQCCLRDPQTM